MSEDDRLKIVAEAAAHAANLAELKISISIEYDVCLLVGPHHVPKGQKTEDAPLIEDRRTVVILDSNYLIALYESRYGVFQKDAEGRWLRRKTLRRVYYKSIRQALADIFEGIIWDRIKKIKNELEFHDNLLFSCEKCNKILLNTNTITSPKIEHSVQVETKQTVTSKPRVRSRSMSVSEPGCGSSKPSDVAPLKRRLRRMSQGS